ncbi:MAG: hypothetical protein EA397_00305 [Deltaproteobacteria bacterium]|nr:MAG: hypothetical protein EA397_00305 [Deltaproteobacteria bacterium]
MSSRPQVSGVALPEGHTGSSFLHELLTEAAKAFPEALATARLPHDARAFKKSFGRCLTRFEAARVASEQRASIARQIRASADGAMRFIDADGVRPLADAVAQARPEPALTLHQTHGPGRLLPAVAIHGSEIGGAALKDWLRRENEIRHLTDAARDRVGDLIDRAEAEDGRFSLKGQRFALLGAGAELAPTRLLLAAGADVLWIDLREPPAELLQADDLGGRLFVPEGPGDLLADPASVAAAVRAFAGADPVHLGMYAYAGGEGQEWRLTASMNAIAAHLGPQVVASISLLISPTTVAMATPEDLAVARERRAKAAAWKKLMGKVGVLRPAGVEAGESRVGDAIVPIQGVSYQAAQYVGKVLAAESFAVFGLTDDPDAPLTVSANTAPITNTRSLSHPLFQAGFIGAPTWQVMISEPDTTRSLNGLLMIGDLIDPDAPGSAARPERGAERAALLFCEQVHGGVFAQPWAMYGEIQLAAVQGLLRRPSLLAALLRGK